jgi:hypothetical protein
MDQRLVTFLNRAQCRCDDCYVAKSPETVEVRGAGSAVAVFVRSRSATNHRNHSKHVVKYERKSGVTLEGEPAIVYIALRKCMHGSCWSIWSRSLANSFSTDFLYETSTKVNWESFPPRDGWYARVLMNKK